MAEITFVDLSVEARTEVILEAAEESAWAIESTDKKIARLAELLKQQKAALGHGNWLPWVKATFGDSDAAVWKVQRWMRGRSNNAPAHYLELDDEDEPQEKPASVVTPRAERKTGRVEVVEPEPDEPGQQSVQGGENAVTQEPKTNTKHSKTTAKAKEADRPGPVIITPEITVDVFDADEETLTQTVTFPERVFLSDFSVAEMLEYLKESADDAKKRAKQLRRVADELDPPTKFVKPDLDECLEFFQSLDSDQGEQFYDFYASKGWIVGKVPMKDWKAAGRRWIRENEKGTFSNGNGQPRLTAAQHRENANASAFNSIRAAIAAGSD